MMPLYGDYLARLRQLLDKIECNGSFSSDYESSWREVAIAVEDDRSPKNKEIPVNCSNIPDNYGNTKVSEAVSATIALLENCRCTGNKVMWIGNGGSAAIASHGAIDCWKNGGIKSVAFNEGPLLTCIGNDFGYAAVFEKPIEMFAEQNDVLIAISSSGKSENILNGVRKAREKGCTTVTMSGFSPDNPLRTMGDINFYVPSNHYGHVELVHGILCHSLVDLLISKDRGKKTW